MQDQFWLPQPNPGKQPASPKEVWLDRLDPEEFHNSTRGWSFECNYVWAMPVNPGTLPGSAIETRIAEWDLVHIATAEGDGDDEHAYDAQNVAHNRSWDDLDLESTFEHPTRERPDQAQVREGVVGIRGRGIRRPGAHRIRHRRPDRRGGRRLPEPEEILSDHREPRERSALAAERRLSAADQRAENTTEREDYREAGQGIVFHPFRDGAHRALALAAQFHRQVADAILGALRPLLANLCQVVHGLRRLVDPRPELLDGVGCLAKAQ